MANNVSRVDLKHGCFLVPAMFLHVCDITKEKVEVFLALEQILRLKRADKCSGKSVSIPQSLH